MKGKNITTSPVIFFCPWYLQPGRHCKNHREFIPKDVTLLKQKIDRIVPEENKVLLAGNQEQPYDVLIIATGAKIAPEETEGMAGKWQKSVFDFYTFEGALALRNKTKGMARRKTGGAYYRNAH